MTAQWKSALLPRLEGFFLAPYGGGPDGKRPLGGDEWQNKLETVAQIQQRNGSCPCVGIYPSPDSGVEVFDIDGKKAHQYLIDNGINVDATIKNGAWKIFRKSDPYRYKVVFRVENPDNLTVGSSTIVLQKADKPNNVKQEAVEYFYGGQGAIVAGLHKSSGDYYQWENGPNGNGASDLPVAPIEWLKLRAIIRAKKTKAANVVADGQEWFNAYSIFNGSCPSCGRNEGDACRATVDGKNLLCYHGATFAPNLNGIIGEHRIVANDKTLVLRSHEKKHWGNCSLFTIETEVDLNKLIDNEIRHERTASFRNTLSSEIDLQDIFPPTLAHLLERRASALPCDAAAYLMPILTTAASTIGKRVAFQVQDGYVEPCVIWGGNVMEPSSLKSPISTDAIRPLEIIEGESIERCKPRDGDDPKDIELPRRYVIEGATHAALVTIACQEKTMGLVIYHDELTSFFREMEKAHNTTMRAEMLKLWSGGKISYDTKTSGHLHTPKTAISLFGNIQPDKLRELISADGGSTSSGDGLWCRFLWCRPKETVWEFNTIEADITNELVDIFKKLDNVTEQKLKLSAEALAMAAPVWNQWERERPDLDPAETAFVGKLRGYSTRVAGVLHLMDLAADQASNAGPLATGDRLIPPEAMERAIRLCRYCRKQWQQLQAELGLSAMPPSVAKFIRKVEAVGWVTVSPRDVIKWKIIGRSTTTAEASAFLQDLAERWGHGSLSRGRHGGIQWHCQA